MRPDSVHDEYLSARRWAEDIQDGPLQGLAAMKLLLATAAEQGSSKDLEAAAAACLRQIDAEIGTLRSTVSEMRETAAESHAA